MGLFIPIVKISDNSEKQQLYIKSSYFQDNGGGRLVVFNMSLRLTTSQIFGLKQYYKHIHLTSLSLIFKLTPVWLHENNNRSTHEFIHLIRQTNLLYSAITFLPLS